MRLLKSSGVMISSLVSSPMRSEIPAKLVPPFAAASFSSAAAHWSKSAKSLSGSCLHSTNVPISTQPIPEPLPLLLLLLPALLPFVLLFGRVMLPADGVDGFEDFGEETSLLTEVFVRAFTVTFVEICWGWEFAADVVNSSCWTISTENLCTSFWCCWVVHWSFTGGSK